MGNYKISRRNFISSAGTVFVLPLLESLIPFSTAFAQVAADPRRWVVFYMPNGTYNRPDKPLWVPPSVAPLSGSNTTDVFSPFFANYSQMTAISGLKSKARLNTVYGDDHEASLQAYITQQTSINSTVTSYDHLFADKLGKPALNLHGGDYRGDLPGDVCLSFRDGKGLRGFSNVGDLYRDLYNKVVPSSNTTPQFDSNKKSILDSSLADLNALKTRVGIKDSQKLDEFMTSLRALELKIQSTSATTVSSSAACVRPTLDPTLDTSDASNINIYTDRFKAFNEMIKIAFACDITRTVSVLFDSETTARTFVDAPSNLAYNGFNIGGGFESHIGISHSSPVSTRIPRCIVRDRILLNIIVDLANRLNSVSDPSGSKILDNTIIQAGYGIEDGNHEMWSTGVGPLLLMGGRNLISTGRHVNLSGYDMVDLIYSINTFLGAGVSSINGSTTKVPL
jgi:hypothetical protein